MITIMTARTAGDGTSGPSDEWCFVSGTNVMEAQPADVTTADFTGLIPFPFDLPDNASAVSAPQPLDRMQQAIVKLLTFSIEPDQPADEDIEPRPAYSLPW